MRRKIDQYLKNWKEKKDRKPLIIKGARQVGKTYSIREFGKTYKSFIEINFVTHPEFKSIFSQGYPLQRLHTHRPALIRGPYSVHLRTDH